MSRDSRAYNSFHEVTERLDQIVHDVRSKDTSLEKSLDLFDEAIGLGSKAVELVDKTDFSPEEKERMADLSEEKATEAQEREGENLAEALLAEQGAEAVAEGDGMVTPSHAEGQSAEEAALGRAIDDADDGAWSPDPAER